MSASAILSNLIARGFSLSIEGDRLLVSPRDRITDHWRTLIRAHKADLITQLQGAHHGDRQPPLLTPDQRADIQEAIAERAAIMEFDAGVPRTQADTEAANAMRVYHYRLTDRPDWLVMIAPGCDLAEARRALIGRFGAERLIDVRFHHPKVTR